MKSVCFVTFIKMVYFCRWEGLLQPPANTCQLLTTASTAHLELSYELEDVQIFVDMYRAYWARKLSIRMNNQSKAQQISKKYDTRQLH